MKKILSVIFTIVIISLVTGCSKKQEQLLQENNEIIKHSAAVENNKTVKPYKPFEDFYTPAFQLIWNDFSDKLVKHKVEFVDGNPPFADNLNKKRLTEDMLLPEDYYKIIAPQTYDTKHTIEKAIKDKFNETSKLLDSFKWFKEDDGYSKILYCMFKKNIYFEQEFEHLNSFHFNNSEKNYKYFGVKSNQSKLGQMVKPLYYKDENDFAVKLCTKSGDEIILQTLQDDKPVFDYWDNLYNEYLKTNKKIVFCPKDELAVPEIKYSQMLNYRELCRHKIKNSDYIITQAIEAVDFKLNAKGAELRNEAGMGVGTTSVIHSSLYIFNKPFILFLRSKDANVPYFALKIKDERYLVQ